MADALIKVSEPSVADKNVDTESLVGAGGATVQRERVEIAGAALAAIAAVKNATGATGDYALVVRTLFDNLINTALVASACIAGQFDDASTTAATEDNVAPVRITAQRAFHTNLRSAAGTELLGQKAMAGSIPVVLASDETALPVTDNAGSLTVDAPVGTPVFVKLSDGAASLVGQKAMAASIPVVLASDESALPVTDNSGSLTVDAPVGTPVFVKLSDGAASLVGQKAMAASIPVVLASDETALPITDNSGSLTVDAPVGTPVFVKLSDGAASLVGQKAMAASIPVVLASDESALPITDNSGSLTVDAPVGTPVFTRLSDGAATLIGQKAMAASLPVVLASDQASVPVTADVRRGVTLLFAKVDVSSSGDNSIVAAAGGSLKIKVVSYVLVADAAVNVKWRSATTDLMGAAAFAANSGVSASGSPGSWLLETAANVALNLNLSGAIGVRGHICYFTEV